MRAAGYLTLCIMALHATALALADGDWPASVGSTEPTHYFGDVRDERGCFISPSLTLIGLLYRLPAPCRCHVCLPLCLDAVYT